VVCGLFGRTRQAWYKHRWAGDNTDIRDTVILKQVQELRQDIPRIGTRKLLHLLSPVLQQHKIEIGRDKFFDLLAAHNMLVRRRKRRKAITTDSNHPFYKYPNLVKDIEPHRPDHIWVSDITYLRTAGSFSYLSLVTDAYSRKIVGYCLYLTLERTGPVKAAQMAIANCSRNNDQPLIHHSDRGLQYCCADYVSLMEKHGITISMTEKGSPYENAIAERMNGILKHQLGLKQTFANFTEAQQAVEKAIAAYNNLYPHGSCNYLTPEQAHKQTGKLTSKWKQKQSATPVN
jgi:transposase InsO family protein